MKQNILVVKNIVKKFGSFTAVDDISFTVKEGEIVGLLGPNGAGKTTTIQMLLGVLTPTSGDISYFGHSFNDHREEILEKVNFSSTYTNLPWRLTVRENLTWVSYLYDIKKRGERIKETIESFKLEKLAKKSIAQLSAGEKTRVNLAKAFINSPQILLLDEPTASMDPDIAFYLRELILRRQKKYNMSIIWTSHNMAEVEDVCDRVVFINKGRVIASDTPSVLARSIKNAHVALMIQDGLKRVIAYAKEQNLNYRIDKRSITIDVKEAEIATFLQELMKQGIRYDEISIEKPTLEDYFLEAAKI